MYNTTDFSFGDFISSNSYTDLQNRFLIHDHRSGYVDLKEPISDSDIILYDINYFSNEETYEEKWLFKDFLLPGISRLSYNHFKKFQKSIYSKGLYTPELVDGLAKTYFERIRKTKATFEKVEYLADNIRIKLLEELNFFEQRLEEYIENPFPNVLSKFKFNWNRIDILMFFHLLRLNGQCAWIEDADLGRILDNVFEYQIKDGKYVEITKSRKHLNDFKNLKGRSQEQALTRLRERLSSEDFYAIK